MGPKRKSSRLEENGAKAKKPKSAESVSNKTPKSKPAKPPTTKDVKGSKKDKNEGDRSEKKHYPKNINEDTNIETSEDLEDIKFTEPLPKANAKGQLVFPDFPDFRPNMTPKEVLQAGSFGGTYFRPIYSSITKKKYSGVWKELPKDWVKALDIGRQVSSSTYRNDINTYNAKCGGSLEMWEESGWMHKQDPYGWYQWYCRFYQGRRSDDDERQVGRWLRCAGVTGRWRNNLISKCVKSGCAFDNPAVSPVVRQTLQHWAYKLNKEDYDVYAKKMKKKGLA